MVNFISGTVGITKAYRFLFKDRLKKGGAMHVKVLIKRDMIAGKEKDFFLH